MRHIGGSKRDCFNSALLTEVVHTQYRSKFANADDEDMQRGMTDYAALAMRGFAPQDEVEGMIAAQAVGLHNVAMEAMRRAMIREQPHQVQMNLLNAANKLCGTYARLVEVLDKRRGKGGQKVVVEYVHVAAGGQAIVGNVEAGGGVIPQNGGLPHAKQIEAANEPVAPLWSQDAGGDALPVASNAERSMPDARRRVTRRAKGQG